MTKEEHMRAKAKLRRALEISRAMVLARESEPISAAVPDVCIFDDAIDALDQLYTSAGDVAYREFVAAIRDANQRTDISPTQFTSLVVNALIAFDRDHPKNF